MKIIIEPETLRRMKGFTNLAGGEVCGMARVNIGQVKVPYIHDLILLPDQEVSGSSAILDNTKLAIFLSTVDKPEEFKFLWHSHVYMSVGLSPKDETCIIGFIKTSPYLISCVTNKRGEMFIQMDAMIEGIRLSQACNLSSIPENYNDLLPELNTNVKQAPDNLFINRYVPHHFVDDEQYIGIETDEEDNKKQKTRDLPLFGRRRFWDWR